jgi:hypothetical protein
MRFCAVILAVTAVCAAFPVMGRAELVGVAVGDPVIQFDSTGVTVYDAANQAFAVDAKLIAMRLGGTTRLLLPLGSSTIHIRLTVSNTGDAAGVAGADLLLAGNFDANADGIVDYSGVLLQGELAAFGYLNAGATTDRFDFVFRTTGGALAGLVGGTVGIQMTSEHSTFVNFAANFAGGAKGALGTVAGEACPRTPGYWKNHREAWPVDSLVIGGVLYNDTQLMNLLDNKTPDGLRAANDETVKLAKFLVATKLSLLSNAVPGDIAPTVLAGDLFLAMYGIGGLPADAEADAILLKDALDAYCNIEFDDSGVTPPYTSVSPEPTPLGDESEPDAGKPEKKTPPGQAKKK